jgi:3-polyprenyl-4-hydroxybenzoate decarboxylase
MQKDIRYGERANYQPRDYYHNRIISNLFRTARKIAWASIMSEVSIQEEIQKQKKKKIKRQIKTQETANILSMYK